MRKIVLAVFVSLILVPSVATFALAGTLGDPHSSAGSSDKSGDGGGKPVTQDPADGNPDGSSHDGLIRIES